MPREEWNAPTNSFIKRSLVSRRHMPSGVPSLPSGNYWQIGVKPDDGQTYYVNIGLR
jgi:hypothetical protein